jgi:hypothetical protein
LEQRIRVAVRAKLEGVQKRRCKLSDVTVAAREEIKVTVVQWTYQLIAFFDSCQKLIGGHMSVDGLPQLLVADTGVKYDASNLSE